MTLVHHHDCRASVPTALARGRPRPKRACSLRSGRIHFIGQLSVAKFAFPMTRSHDAVQGVLTTQCRSNPFPASAPSVSIVGSGFWFSDHPITRSPDFSTPSPSIPRSKRLTRLIPSHARSPDHQIPRSPDALLRASVSPWWNLPPLRSSAAICG